MKSKPSICTGIFGSADFCRRITLAIRNATLNCHTCSGLLSDAWSSILSEKPHIVICEIGLYHNAQTHEALRQLLSRLRDRHGNEQVVIVALTAPSNLAYGGDLLFANDTEMTPSGFVDMFIAGVPDNLPSLPPLAEQVHDVIRSYISEIARRQSGKPPLPALADDGWAPSMASPQSRELWMQWLPRYARYVNESPVITGPTGTGKTNLAKATHMLSGRTGPFVSITPRDFSSSELIQSELFGAVAGAYTGAVDKWGLVKSAEGGTLFIDELQSIDKDLQGKLITFIENKAYRRVGSSESIQADVRFAFATNRTLSDMVESDILREDFAYRLERVELNLLPLNRRPLDVAAALAYALAKIRRQRPQMRPIKGATRVAYKQLFCHSWPGNLRQLENATAQLCEVADIRDLDQIDEQVVNTVFESKLLGPAITAPEVISQAASRLAQSSLQHQLQSAEDSLECFTTQLRDCALEATGGDVERAAALLGESNNLMEIYTGSQVAKRAVAPFNQDR